MPSYHSGNQVWNTSSRAKSEHIEAAARVEFSHKEHGAHGNRQTRIIETYFRNQGVLLPPMMELGNMDTIKEFAKIGVGAGIVAPWIVQSDLQEGSLEMRTLGPDRIEREWGIFTASNRQLSIREDNFIGLCESVCSGLTAD